MMVKEKRIVAHSQRESHQLFSCVPLHHASKHLIRPPADVLRIVRKGHTAVFTAGTVWKWQSHKTVLELLIYVSP